MNPPDNRPTVSLRELFDRFEDADRLDLDSVVLSGDEAEKYFERLSSLCPSRPPYKDRIIRSLLWLVVSFHMLIIVINFLAFFIIPFMYPVWIWMPINSFILTVMFTREVCPLTRLENIIRKSLGMRKIGGFVGHYILRR